MKKTLFLLIFCHLAITSFAQGWAGFENGLYSGISSANARPGGMMATPYQVDATLFGVHILAQTEDLLKNRDAFSQMLSGGLKGLSGFGNIRTNSTSLSTNIQGPSALWRIKSKCTMALSWNLRFFWSSRASTPELTELFTGSSSSVNLDGSGETVTTSLNSWNEFGLGASGRIWEKPGHQLDMGGFFKMVFGMSNWELELEDLNIQVADNAIQHADFNLRMQLSQQAYELVDEGQLNLFDRAGMGFDIGAEYRRTGQADGTKPGQLRYRVGFALNDIGFMRYNPALEYSAVQVSADNISLDRFTGLDTIRSVVDTLAAIFDIHPEETDPYGIRLPMSLRLYADYHLGRSFYLYGETHLQFLNMTNRFNNGKVFFEQIISPRYETEQFGVYLPLNFSNVQPANAGIALRWKPFIVGSSNLLTFYAYSGRFLDLYFKVKIPVLPKKERGRYQKKQAKLPATAFHTAF